MTQLIDESKSPAIMPHYNKEAGVLVSRSGDGIMFIEGEKGHVTFPAETILKIHQKAPDMILMFAHTHPIGMENASALDMHMLETWAKALYPFPARLSVITLLTENLNYSTFSEKIYFARWQDKEEWEKDKTKERKVDIRVESDDIFTDPLYGWRKWLVEFSYEQ